jgi:hypothetical protein
VLTPAKGLLYCFAAKKGGDCIGLAAHVMNVGNNDAANFLADQLGTAHGTVIPDRGSSIVSKKGATQRPKSRRAGNNRAPHHSMPRHTQLNWNIPTKWQRLGSRKNTPLSFR